MDPVALLELFESVATAIRAGLDDLTDWGPASGHPGQYQHDVVADAIAVPMLLDAGLGLVSEESPPVGGDRDILAIIDPIDGSTNAAMGLPWFATSICAVDASGPLAGLVVNQATGASYRAHRGGGAFRDGVAIRPSACKSTSDAIVILNDRAPANLHWRQYRALGAAALDICAVADGTADAYVDFGTGLAPWDYLGALLVCQEAGAMIAGIDGESLVDTSVDHRVRPIAAATSELLVDLTAALD